MIALLVGGPGVGLAIAIKVSNEATTRFALQLLPMCLGIPVALYYYLQSPRRTKGIAFADLTFFLVLLAGVPGAVMNVLSPADPTKQQVGISRLVSVAAFDPRYQLLFVILLILRGTVLYFWIPRSHVTPYGELVNRLAGWMLAACTVLNLMSLQLAISSGININSSRRLGEDDTTFISVNTASGFSALAVILAVGLRLKWWIRYPVGLLGLYITLLTQSRGALLGLFAVLILQAGIALWQTESERRAKLTVWLAGFVMILAVSTPLIVQLGPVQRIVERSQRADPTTGRIDILNEALDSLALSPALGVGWSSPGTRFENGPISLAVEIGAPATVFAYLLILWTMGVSMRSMRSTEPGERQLGTISFTLLVFFALRGLTERTHVFQLTNSLSNLWLILTGMLVQHHLGSKRHAPATLPAPSAKSQTI